MPRHLVFCGTYTDLSLQGGGDPAGDRSAIGVPELTGSDGIHVFEHDPDSGGLRPIHTVEGVVNPSYLALDDSERFLFAVNETRELDGEPTGAVSSFAIDPETDMPSFVSQQPSGGGNPCHLSVSRCGRYLLVANHEAATIAVLPIDAQGGLSPPVDVRTDEPTDPTGQRPPHAHFVAPDPGGAFVVSTDTGTDRIMSYRLDAEHGRLIPNDPPWGETHPGGSPRHLDFHPAGRFVYANGEADLTLSVFRYDPAGGTLDHIQHVPTVPDGIDTREFSTAQIVAHPSGSFVYVSNRGHNSIAVFQVDGATGMVTRIAVESTRGHTPRNFMIDPTGRFLYVGNQDSGTIECFSIDQQSGLLTHSMRAADIPAPTCIRFTTA